MLNLCSSTPSIGACISLESIVHPHFQGLSAVNKNTDGKHDDDADLNCNNSEVFDLDSEPPSLVQFSRGSSKPIDRGHQCLY